MGEIHSQNGVARLECREIDGHVGLRTGVRLDVNVIGAEELLRPFDGEFFGYINEFAAAVISFVGISLGIFVRHDGTLCFEHRFADKIFRRDKLQFSRLSSRFILY